MLMDFKCKTGEVLEFVEKPSDPFGWCVIKHDPNRDTGLKNPPDEIPLADSPVSVAQLGHGIPILPAVWDYLRKINNDAAFAWLKTSNAMWINFSGETEPREIDIVNEKVSAESIIGGGNLCKFYKDAGWESERRVHIVARPYTFNFATLDPKQDNFYGNMGAYWYPTSIDAAGHIYKVAGGIDPFIPILEYTQLWIDKSKVVILESKPEFWGISDVMSQWV